MKSAAKWDCVRNDTGKYLRLMLASHRQAGSYPIVAPGVTVRFQISAETKVMAIVAFEHGVNNLVTLTSFHTLPQEYPPTNCYPITETTAAIAELQRVEAPSPQPSEELF